MTPACSWRPTPAFFSAHRRQSPPNSPSSRSRKITLSCKPSFDSSDLLMSRNPPKQRRTINGVMEEAMINTRWATVFTIGVFFLGFALGGVSLHYAQAQGLMGLTPSIQQIGTALTEMQKNVNDLQKNMGTIKQAKENLTSLVPGGGESIPKDGDSLKKRIPGMGQ